MPDDGTRACRVNLLKKQMERELDERNLLKKTEGLCRPFPASKKAFVNFLIETLFAALKSFRLSGIRLINLDSAVLMTFGSHKQAYGRSV